MTDAAINVCVRTEHGAAMCLYRGKPKEADALEQLVLEEVRDLDKARTDAR